MTTLLNKWFICSCIVWLVIFTTRKAGHPIPFFNGYAADAVAVPVIANLGLWFKRAVIIKNNYYTLSVWHVVFITVYLSVVFEWVLPRLSRTYTADWADVLLYAAGGAFFYKVMNKPVAEFRN